MVIGVTGYKGRLGQALVKKGCIGLDLDVTDRVSIDKTLEQVQPDVIINCAAKTNVDGCETDIVRTYMVNMIGVYNLSLKFSGQIVQISTDYIFDGKVGRYREMDVANPLSVYGYSKYFGEVGIRQKENSLVVRSTILYGGHNNKNSDFVTKVYNKLSTGQLVHCPDQLLGNPTYVEHLVEGILYTIENRLIGIINISGLDWLSRYDMALKIADIGGFNRDLVVKGNIYGDAQRPMFGGFNLVKAKALKIPLYTFEQGLIEWFRKDKK